MLTEPTSGEKLLQDHFTGTKYNEGLIEPLDKPLVQCQTIGGQ